MIAKQTFKECLRRKVFLVVPIVTLGFLGLYALGNHYAFREIGGTTALDGGPVDTRSLAGATLVGLAMFVSLFLASALGVFLALSAVRGDAETGVLQQLVVRPVSRRGILAGRFMGASLLCMTYVIVLYVGAVLITGAIGGWWPNPFIPPALTLALGIPVIVALTLLGSVFLTSMTNGIVMFMIYGAGLLAGLLTQLGNALNVSGLETTGRVVSYALPFEALYQSSLDYLTSGTSGLTRVIVQLGPLGGAERGGAPLLVWVVAYLVLTASVAVAAFDRRDL